MIDVERRFRLPPLPPSYPLIDATAAGDVEMWKCMTQVRAPRAQHALDGEPIALVSRWLATNDGAASREAAPGRRARRRPRAHLRTHERRRRAGLCSARKWVRRLDDVFRLDGNDGHDHPAAGLCERDRDQAELERDANRCGHRPGRARRAHLEPVRDTRTPWLSDGLHGSRRKVRGSRHRRSRGPRARSSHACRAACAHTPGDPSRTCPRRSSELRPVAGHRPVQPIRCSIEHHRRRGWLPTAALRPTHAEPFAPRGSVGPLVAGATRTSV